MKGRVKGQGNPPCGVYPISVPGEPTLGIQHLKLPELSVHSFMAHKWGSTSQPPNSFPHMMMNHVKQNEYANLLRAGLTSMGAETNKWILNKKTAQAMQLLLISPPLPLGLHPPHRCTPVSSQFVHSGGWMKEAAEAWAGMSSGLGLVRVFPFRSPIPMATAAGPSGGVMW